MAQGRFNEWTPPCLGVEPVYRRLGVHAYNIQPFFKHCCGMHTKVKRLHQQARSLITEFKQTGEASYADEAIILDYEALELCPSDHPERRDSLTCLATHLSDRYSRLGTLNDLEEAVVLAREALALCPQEHRSRWTSLDNLAIHLHTRYRQLGMIEDLDKAIVLDREALNFCPQGHSDRPSPLSNLALCLFTRYNQLGVTEDLDEAMKLNQEALRLRQKGHPNRSTSLNNLANCFASRYNQLGVMKDLAEAIILHREALDLRVQGHPDRPASLNNLLMVLFVRYRQLGTTEDLHEAITLGREGLALCPQGHPRRPAPLINIAAVLSSRYKQTGVMGDLDEAIVFDREALELLPCGHPDRSMSLNNLADDLYIRYNQLGVIEDIDEAITLSRESLSLRPQGHPERSMSLSNLALFLSSRHKQLGVMEDLNEAIVLHREGLDLRPQGHPNRPMSLNNLASCLSARYSQLGIMKDLDEAIILHCRAVDSRQKGNPFRPLSLNNLADVLFTRYKQLGVAEDLDGAIVLGREALGLCPQGHPDRSVSLNNLTRYLCDRFISRSAQSRDKEEVFSLYAQLAHTPQFVSSEDLYAAKAWIGVAESFHHPTLLLAHETSLRLLIQHLATLPSLPRHLVILRSLTSSLAVDAFSLCLHRDAPVRAVELLEQGRGVFWSQLTRLHSLLDDVIAFGPTGKLLADEFTRLATIIRHAFHSPGTDQHERVCHLNIEMQKIVADIRKLPGLSRFLLPLLFSNLQRAASGGPVIIVNASKYSCDALIVFLDRDPVHIPLRVTQEGVRELATELHSLTLRTKRSNMTRKFAAFLRKVWDQIVSHIVDFLQTTCPSGSRIWWCPTAEFSLLPLHAAGPYREGQPNLVDLYISSYTPTLTALIRARRPGLPNSATERKRFIAIGQAKAAGESELLSVGAELDNIRQSVDGLATFTYIDGEESYVSRIVEELGRNEWVHFACHGLPNRKQPFESAFALHDGPFTVERIIACDLQNPEFAYLSACHTTVGDEESPDEVIHLASAMQFVGFRSVIGTMWAVDDGETNKITTTFYRHMVDELGQLDHTRAALALNETMKSVRIPFDQRILYIHLGA